MKKKLFVISDPHGYASLLKKKLDEAGFDPENPEHLLIGCGDYFDRGHENLQMLQYLDRLKHKVLLRGNHEDMLEEILLTGQLKQHNYLNGTVQTVVDLFGSRSLDDLGRIDFSGNNRTADRMLDFIRSLESYYETDHYVFTHGWLPVEGNRILPGWRNACAQAWQQARWTKWTQIYAKGERLPGKTVVCGHVPSVYAASFCSDRTQHDTTVFYGEGLIVVDAGTDMTGHLNVLVLEDTVLTDCRS